jgi:hypothetical protein
MTLFPGPGVLMVTGAGLLQETAVGPPPLPGGVAAVLRFFFNLPQWVQIAGFFLGLAVAALVVTMLWRRRRAIVGWVMTRQRGLKIGLTAAAATVLLGVAGFGTVSWNYMQHDNGFCTGCHVMNVPFQRFAGSKHDSLSCHDCHQQSMLASMRQLYLWVAERPHEIGQHAKVPTRVCASCHVTDQKEKWQRIATTAGHRTHLESDSSALRGVQCVTCHGFEVHRFVPVNATCAQSGCHVTTTIQLGKMAGQTDMHCVACHQFTADVPRLATRDSAAGTLRPGARQCLGCHEMRAMLADFDPARDPHRQTCGMCHNPHVQTRPADALKTCASAGCHADWRAEPFHTGQPHQKVALQCTTCHQPHGAKVDASDCAGCHAAVRERTHGRRAPPMPFDTTKALRRTSWVPPLEEPLKGKGDGSPPREVARAPRSSLPAPSDTFPHDRHRSLACITCHTTRQGGTRLTFAAPRGCQLCHHQAPAASDCASCHAAGERAGPDTVNAVVEVAGHASRERPVAFRHERHQRLRCVECHSTPVTLDPAPAAAACRTCHENHHAAGQDCAFCHGGADPAKAHATLADFHVACDNCHAEKVVAFLTPDRAFCQTCHADRPAHYAGRECTVCHFLSSPDGYRAHLRKDGGQEGA